MAFVYILYSKSIDQYYVGATNDLSVRILRHNAGHSLSTRKGIPWELKYSEVYLTKSESMKREAEIKRMKSRRYVEELIKNQNENAQKETQDE